MTKNAEKVIEQEKLSGFVVSSPANSMASWRVCNLPGSTKVAPLSPALRSRPWNRGCLSPGGMFEVFNNEQPAGYVSLPIHSLADVVVGSELLIQRGDSVDWTIGILVATPSKVLLASGEIRAAATPAAVLALGNNYTPPGIKRPMRCLGISESGQVVLTTDEGHHVTGELTSLGALASGGDCFAFQASPDAWALGAW